MGYSKEIKTQSKIELRADIIKNLSILKTDCSSTNLNKVIKQFKKNPDKKLLLSILIKELSGEDKNYDNIVKIIIIDVFGKSCEDELQKALLDEKNSDLKRIFIVDVLRELDVKIGYNELDNYIENPKKLLDDETSFFLKDLIKSPSKQIDLLDFLYGSIREDSTIFLQYVIENYSGDELANILSLSSFILYDDTILETIINTLGKTKSYYAFEAFSYITRKNKDENIQKLITRAKNKLNLIGLDENLVKDEISKKSLSDTKFYEAKVSLFDSKGDFILTFSRINTKEKIDVFFVAFNLLYGILASFGFENITSEDYKKTLDKIFNDNLSIDISPNIAKALIDDAIINGEDDAPYEILAWRRLTYDIKEENNILKFPKEFENFQLNNVSYSMFLKKDYFKTWFIKENENPYFKNLLLDIKMLDVINRVNLEDIIEKYIDEIFEYKICFRTTLLMQGYFLYQGQRQNEAKIFYTIANNNEIYHDFCVKILHKSIYEHFLEDKSEIKKYLSKDFLGIMEKWQREF